MILAADTALQGAAASSESAYTLTTDYSGYVIPAINMIMVALCAVIVAVVAVAGLIYVTRHFKNWGPGVLAGIFAQLLFCFLLYVGISFGLSKLPLTATAVSENTLGYRLFDYVLTMVLTVAAVFFGMRYAMANADKKGLPVDVGIALGFGTAFLIASVLEGSTLTNPIQYVMLSMSVNQMGFDPAAASLVEGGLTESEAITFLLSLVEWDWFAYLCEYLSILCSAVINTCVAVMVYGVYREKLIPKWLLITLGGFVVFWLPGLINIVVKLPTVLLILIMFAVTAGVVFVTWTTLSVIMKEDWALMKAKGQSNSILGRKKPAEPQKMPKIKMPD